MFEVEERYDETDLLNEEEGNEEIDAGRGNEREPLVRTENVRRDLGGLQIITRSDSHNHCLARTQDS